MCENYCSIREGEFEDAVGPDRRRRFVEFPYDPLWYGIPDRATARVIPRLVAPSPFRSIDGLGEDDKAVIAP